MTTTPPVDAEVQGDEPPSPDGGTDAPPHDGSVASGSVPDVAESTGTPEEEAAAEERRARRHAVLISVSTWVRNIGALLILFAAWQLWGTAIAQHNSQDALKKQFAAKVHATPHVGSKFTLVPASVNLPNPPSGAPMAIIQIPKIGVDQIVVSGTDESDLALGPGHYVGTALPGQAGNVAIAGHRTTHGAPFNRLAELAPGDPIYLTDQAGQRLTYKVAFTPFPVSPSNTSVLNYFGDNRLTLTTCNPEFSARQRLIVVAGFVSGPGSHVGPSRQGRRRWETLQGHPQW